jgi:serine protease inhibitor
VFNKTFTKREPFFDKDQTRTIGEVNMMFQRGSFPYVALQEIGSYVVELPYGTRNRNVNDESGIEDRISMIVILPKKGLSLIDAIDNVNTYGMEKLFKELKRSKDEFEDDEVEVHIPKFELETSLNLVDSLKEVIF